MHKRVFRPIAAIMIFLSLQAAAAEIAWHNGDMASAIRKAGEEGKLVHIFVEGDNCPPCDAYKASHLADPAYVDYVNTLFVNVRLHEGNPAAKAVLESMKLLHSAVPRFYILGPDGKGVSMTVGMVNVPPMEGAEVLKMAAGRELPVDRAKAAALASRLRNHRVSQTAAGTVYPDNPLRLLGVAVLETQAWALAGRLDEAEKSFGREWADRLVDQEVRDWYITFWLGWKSNAAGVLAAAEAFRAANPDDPAGTWHMAQAMAANGRYAEAATLGDTLVAATPDNQRLADTVAQWRRLSGR